MSQPLAVYVHIPFCPSKCGYCDFNSFAMDGPIVERTARAIIRQIERSAWAGRPAQTIFFGGGTPTFLPAEWQVEILRAVVAVHPPAGDIEITTEANPGTVDAAKFEALRRAGFNRLSVGAQSFDDRELLSLDRVHSSSEIVKAVDAARTAGFQNINLDLMFALPGQSHKAWKFNLDRAISLQPEHLSLYCLTLEPNTAFYKRHLKGDLVLPPEETQAEMLEQTERAADAAGFKQYEISNFAKPGFECQHNLCYWRGVEYAGYGPGAVWRVGDARGTNLKHPERYAEAVDLSGPLFVEEESLDASILRTESIMLGLRLNEGVSAAALALDPVAVDKVRERGWAETTADRLTLTRLGRRFCSEATVALL